jgi:hypothetical protein
VDHPTAAFRENCSLMRCSISRRWPGFLEGLNVKTVVRDERVAGNPIDATFHGSLMPTA